MHSLHSKILWSILHSDSLLALEIEEALSYLFSLNIWGINLTTMQRWMCCLLAYLFVINSVETDTMGPESGYFPLEVIMSVG